MKATEPITIALIEPTPIIRLGIEALLRKIPGYKVQVIDMSDIPDQYEKEAEYRQVDMLLINPFIGGIALSQSFSRAAEGRNIALVSTPLFQQHLSGYDYHIQLSDTAEAVGELFNRIFKQKSETKEPIPEQQSLTAREKEIVIGVVKGLTNKEIASTLFLSTHTVVTHRRNIAKKLQIHSASGLTIYAIVNKLVELDDISK